MVTQDGRTTGRQLAIEQASGAYERYSHRVDRTDPIVDPFLDPRLRDKLRSREGVSTPGVADRLGIHVNTVSLLRKERNKVGRSDVHPNVLPETDVVIVPSGGGAYSQESESGALDRWRLQTGRGIWNARTGELLREKVRHGGIPPGLPKKKAPTSAGK